MAIPHSETRRRILKGIGAMAALSISGCGPLEFIHPNKVYADTQEVRFENRLKDYLKPGRKVKIVEGKVSIGDATRDRFYVPTGYDTHFVHAFIKTSETMLVEDVENPLLATDSSDYWLVYQSSALGRKMVTIRLNENNLSTMEVQKPNGTLTRGKTFPNGWNDLINEVTIDTASKITNIREGESKVFYRDKNGNLVEMMTAKTLKAVYPGELTTRSRE